MLAEISIPFLLVLGTSQPIRLVAAFLLGVLRMLAGGLSLLLDCIEDESISLSGPEAEDLPP